MDIFMEFLIEGCGFDRDDIDLMLGHGPVAVGVGHHGPMPDIVVAPRDERSCATCERYAAFRDAQGRIVDQHHGHCGLDPIWERLTTSGMVCARWRGGGTVDPEHDVTGATQYLYDPTGTRKL